MFSPSPFLTNSGDSHKKFHSLFQFFSANILASEVTTVRLSVALDIKIVGENFLELPQELE